MRTFFLNRIKDVSGVSGVGDHIAEGIEWDTGKVSLHWLVGSIHSTTLYDKIEEVEVIHGHNGNTYIEWEDKSSKSEINNPTTLTKLLQWLGVVLSSLSLNKH